MFDNYPDVLTVVDVKTALCIGKNAVYALIKNKQIKTIKIGNTYRIPKSNLIAYVMQYC